MEGEALIRDTFTVFRDFGTWYLISGQSRKIRDSWTLCHIYTKKITTNKKQRIYMDDKHITTKMKADQSRDIKLHTK